MSGSSPHAHPTDQKPSAKQKYFQIFAILTFLTVIEVFVPKVYGAGWNSTTKMLLLVILASAKALLVAQHFMHLDHEKKWVKWIAATPIYMGIFAILLMLESVYR